MMKEYSVEKDNIIYKAKLLEDPEEIREAKIREKMFCCCDGDINDMILVDGANIEGLGYIKREGWFCPHCHKFIDIDPFDIEELPESIDPTLHKNFDLAEIYEFPVS